jgi:polysaccharide export outer membrane protein
MMKKPWALLLSVVSSVAFIVFSLWAQEPEKSAPAARAATAQKATEGAAKLPNESEYRIGPQDSLRIDVWKEPEITRTIPVRPDGKISLPLLNDVQAAGLTALELGASIRESLEKFIKDPQVTVTVMEINSRRVYVTGEVLHAGAFPLLPNMTVLQALSSSGGFTQFAKIKSIYVLRQEGGKQAKHPFNYKEVVGGKQPEENILLQPGDVIVVP